MKHLTEEELVLFYYGEGDSRDQAAGHLADCPECAEALRALERSLAPLGEYTAPERNEDYGREVWFRLRPRLQESRQPWWAGLFQRRAWAVAAAMAAMIALAFFAGRQWPGAAPAPAGQRASAEVRERILLVAVGDHLDRSQMVLMELVNAAGEGQVDISDEQRRAQDLVAANRLYRQTALRTGDAGVASVLDELERILVEVANSPARLSSDEFHEIRDRIEQQGILFKVRVIDSQVRRKALPQPISDASQSRS